MPANGPNGVANAARPTINLKSTLVIKSGEGTLKEPYVVGIAN